MDAILRIIIYILTGLGILMTAVFLIGDIILLKRRFRWYYYIPVAVLNIAVGISAPHLFVYWLYLLSEGSALPVVLIPILFITVTVGGNIALFMLFRRREDFSAPFYWSLSLTSLFVISYWLCRLIFV